MYEFFKMEVLDYPILCATSVYIHKTIVARNAKGRFMSVYASMRVIETSGSEEKRLHDLRDVVTHYAKMGNTRVVFCDPLRSAKW